MLATAFRPWARRLTLVMGSATGTATITYASFHLWTRRCAFEEFEPSTDKLFQHPFLKIINPLKNPDSHDCCVRYVPFAEIRSDLLEDAQSGGSKLIEAFTAGMWGGYGYAVQRRIMTLTKTDENKEDLWSKEELLESKYEPGVFFTNHFHVLSKSPTSLIMRACFGPRQDTPVGKSMDGLTELEVQIQKRSNSVAFRFKAITLDGTESSSQSPDPFGGFPGWLHRQYVKLLIESGVDNCTL